MTAIGRKIWETLDYALATRSMVLVDGLEGRGKTEAVKAWCELHLGTARFVSLKGITSKTTAFREIAKALGIASSYTRKATEMQLRIEDVLKQSKLLLLLDEAHFLFNQSRRMYSRPELIDWLDTSIVNRGLGSALVTTPRFIVCMTRAADQVEWNYRQFRRRVARWVKLPPQNTEEDIRAIARSVFKNAPDAAIQEIVGYACCANAIFRPSATWPAKSAPCSARMIWAAQPWIRCIARFMNFFCRQTELSLKAWPQPVRLAVGPFVSRHPPW
ncbi:MAG: AAA family ATPase [Verrucomicrobiota bacterium]|nr:AAA family ATPase [Verrucomicrobiota bacterium]